MTKTSDKRFGKEIAARPNRSIDQSIEAVEWSADEVNTFVIAWLRPIRGVRWLF